jgi:IS605 OrfB family transposase
MNQCFVTYDGTVPQVEYTHRNGKTYKELFNTLWHKRKTSKNKNSRNINQLKTSIKQQANYLAKNIEWNNIKELVLEDLDNLKGDKHLGFAKYVWSYTYIQQRLVNWALEHGVHVKWVDPTNTSRICSRCNSLNTSRVHRTLLVCNDCEYEIDADINASMNIYRRGINSPSCNKRKV